MKYKSAAIIVTLFACSTAFSQVAWQHKRDSLLKVLSVSKEDSNKVQTLLTIGMQYQYNNPDSALFYYKVLGDLSKKINYTRGVLTYLNMTAGVLNRQNKTDEAILLDSQALVLAKSTNNPRSIGRSYINMAIPYKIRGDNYKALEFYLKASALCEQAQDSLSLASLGINMSLVYKALKEYDKACESAQRGIVLARAMNNKSLVNSAYVALSGSLIEAGRLDTALVVLNDSKRLSIELNDTHNTILALINLGDIYVEKDMYSQVKENAELLLKLSTSFDSKEGISNALEELYTYYFYYKNYATAKSYALKAAQFSTENNLPVLLGTAYHLLSLIEILQGNYTEFKRYSGLEDSINSTIQSAEITKNAQDLEARYSLDKKQTQIDNLNKEKNIQQVMLRQRNTINWVLAGAVLAVIFSGFLYYRNNMQKNKLLLAEDRLKQQRIVELEQEKQLLATESVLQGQEEERKRLAKDLHDGLGGILSSAKYSFTNMKNNLIITSENAEAFERGMGMLDQSINELRRVAHNMMPEALVNFGLDTALKDFCLGIRSSGAVEVTYQSFNLADDTVTKNKASVIYRIIQELVNNILKHANAKTALVQLVKKEEALSITVEDDGNGFDIAVLKQSNGIGYANLQSRVAYLNGTIDIQTAPGKGTSVNIDIPNITA